VVDDTGPAGIVEPVHIAWVGEDHEVVLGTRSRLDGLQVGDGLGELGPLPGLA